MLETAFLVPVPEPTASAVLEDIVLRSERQVPDEKMEGGSVDEIKEISREKQQQNPVQMGRALTIKEYKLRRGTEISEADRLQIIQQQCFPDRIQRAARYRTTPVV